MPSVVRLWAAGVKDIDRAKGETLGREGFPVLPNQIDLHTLHACLSQVSLALSHYQMALSADEEDTTCPAWLTCLRDRRMRELESRTAEGAGEDSEGGRLVLEERAHAVDKIARATARARIATTRTTAREHARKEQVRQNLECKRVTCDHWRGEQCRGLPTGALCGALTYSHSGWRRVPLATRSPCQPGSTDQRTKPV